MLFLILINIETLLLKVIHVAYSCFNTIIKLFHFTNFALTKKLTLNFILYTDKIM